MVPVWPLNESTVVPPLQTVVGDALAVPPTEAGVIPTPAIVEFAAAQLPLVITARYCIIPVIGAVL